MDRPIWLGVVVLLLVGQAGAATAVAGGAAHPDERTDPSDAVPSVSPDGSAFADGGRPTDGASDAFPAVPTDSLPTDELSSDDVADAAARAGLAVRDVPRIVVPVAAYSRYDDSDPLANDARAAVYEAVVDSTGDYVASVAETTDTPVSTVRYHVRVLRREGLVATETVRGHRRIYPTGVENRELAAALNDEATATVVSTVRRREPIGVSDLAAEIDRAASTVSHHVSRLTDDGVLVREREGESVLVSLAPATRGAMRGSPADD